MACPSALQDIFFDLSDCDSTDGHPTIQQNFSEHTFDTLRHLFHPAHLPILRIPFLLHFHHDPLDILRDVFVIKKKLKKAMSIPRPVPS